MMYFYKNNGDGTFTDVTKTAKVGGGENNFSVGAVWLDYDNDGYLDLYVGNYLNFDPNYKYYYAPDGFPGPWLMMPSRMFFIITMVTALSKM